MEAVNILGVNIHVLDNAAALGIIEDFVRSGKPHIVVTADSSGVVKAQKDEEFRHIINYADLVTPDGFGIIWASGVLGVPLPERVSGVDMVDRICEMSAKEGYGVYFLGSAPGTAESAAGKLKERYPNLKVAGIDHGFYRDEEWDGVAARVKEAKPDILFVAMGIPKQEKWISARMKELGVPVSMGVGGTFDVISGKIKRAPKWMQRHGLEWAYRLLSNPRKIKKVSALPIFVLYVLRKRLFGR